MAAKIIDGKQVCAGIRAECKERVAELAARGVVPGLAVVLVGADPASAVYVRNKMRACADVGIRSFRFDFPDNVDADRVIAAIEDLNRISSWRKWCGPAPW
jgi:methylenetetrahydrofolate dehydrogenase (NADP+) / methenyltetrahydrofolate cyclohydrolase